MLNILSLTAALLVLSACNLDTTANISGAQQIATETASPTATETIPPYTPLATLTPSRTLRPPPTFEPPTATFVPSATPTVTSTQSLILEVAIPGLRGGESPTPTSTPGCTPRKDWKLTYTVQFNDALSRLADKYGVTTQELADGNCIRDPNILREGQVIRVPGAAHPSQPLYECLAWEALTPMNGTEAVPAQGQLTFNWRGPRAPRNLIRVIEPDGGVWERVVELRQNETVNLAVEFPDPGRYTWYVFPLNENYVQIDCREGGPWTFTKDAPTATPTPES
jgi:LysM repeat protein